MLRRITGVLKIVIPVILFITLIVSIIMTPLRAVNVSMLVYLSSCEDSTDIKLTIAEKGDEPNIQVYQSYAYDSKAVFKLPASIMNNASDISLKISSADSNSGAHTWALYYGKHDIKADTLMQLKSFSEPAIIKDETGVLISFSNSDVKSFNSITANDWITKAVVCGFITFAFLVLIFSIYSFRNKSWCVALRRAFIIMPIVLVVFYILISSVVSDTKSHTTEEFGTNQATSAQYMPVDSKISREFTTSYSGLNSLNFDFKLTGEPAHIGLRLINKDKSVIAFTDTIIIDKSGITAVYVPGHLLNSKATYTIELTKLNPNDNSHLEIASNIITTDSDDGTTQSENVFSLGAGYSNILFSGYTGAVALFICGAVVMLSLFYKKLGISPTAASALIYIIMFIFTAAQIIFFALTTGVTAGETENISYIAHLVKTGNFIPEFGTMPLLNVLSDNAVFLEGSVNPVGTPPLYYLIMKAFGAVKATAEAVSVDVLRLRIYSCVISLVAIALIYVVGFLRINKKVPSFHLLFASVSGSLPSVTYMLSRISPAPIALIGVAVFFVGIMRLAGKRRDAFTYFILSLGLLICCLSDTIIGICSVAITVGYLLFEIFKNKDLKILLRKNAFAALPLLIVTATYYITILILYGSINPEILPAGSGTLMSAVEFTKTYFGDFINLWSTLFKSSFKVSFIPWHSVVNLVTVCLLLAPIMLFKVHKNSKISVLIITYLAAIASVIYRFAVMYANYYYQNNGYSPYSNMMYLCLVPFLAYSAVAPLIELYSTSRVTALKKAEGYICIKPQKTAIITANTTSALILLNGFVFFLFSCEGLI